LKHLTFVICIFIICAFLCCGCQSPARVSAEAGTQGLLSYSFPARSVQGRQICRLDAGNPTDPAVLYIGGIHGNEKTGISLCWDLAEGIADSSIDISGRRVIIIPVFNPDGVAANLRYNANGVDLNRNYPALNREASEVNGVEPINQPESKYIHELILAEQPESIVVFHGYLNCIDYDGPGRELAEKMAAVSPLEVKKLGARPGSLGAWAGETLGIPIICVEFSESDSRLSDKQLWQRYKAMTLSVID
jgi:murein peptide amidase A